MFDDVVKAIYAYWKEWKGMKMSEEDFANTFEDDQKNIVPETSTGYCQFEKQCQIWYTWFNVQVEHGPCFRCHNDTYKVKTYVVPYEIIPLGTLNPNAAWLQKEPYRSLRQKFKAQISLKRYFQ